MMSVSKQKLYKDITNRILLGISPKSLYVFGSYARNQETKDSDIDLLVEMDTDLPLWKRMGPVRRLLRDIRHPFDIKRGNEMGTIPSSINSQPQNCCLTTSQNPEKCISNSEAL